MMFALPAVRSTTWVSNADGRTVHLVALIVVAPEELGKRTLLYGVDSFGNWLTAGPAKDQGKIIQ